MKIERKESRIRKDVPYLRIDRGRPQISETNISARLEIETPETFAIIFVNFAQLAEKKKQKNEKSNPRKKMSFPQVGYYYHAGSSRRHEFTKLQLIAGLSRVRSERFRVTVAFPTKYRPGIAAIPPGVYRALAAEPGYSPEAYEELEAA
ncbi:hypothetical protein K0M31_000009 [Melipona bicolor]|uniref:Uncharacterized protein n=1 Tax=Melipona bicolor TaxID=60889 RepID=A0AA40KWB5_9HYME|nr:hypothetical protein K0M31_000009 [Melipona bicolor]